MKTQEIITNIKRIVNKWGMFSINEVDGEENIILSKSTKDSEWLIEKIGYDAVQCTEYINGVEVNEAAIGYFQLTKDQLEDILLIAENYEAEQLKTEKRCSTCQ